MSSTTAFLHSKLSSSSSDRPIFSRQRISHTPPHPITHVVTSNLQIVLVMANKTLQRIDQSGRSRQGGGAAIETVDFSKACLGHKVLHAFLDPKGVHLILSLRPTDPEGQPELLYLNRRTTKPRLAAKLKGHQVTSVAWNTRNNSDTVTGPILLGTSKGIILETELDSGEDRMFASSLEKYVKPCIDLGRGSHLPLTGLAFFHVEGTLKYFVIATSANRLYQFAGVAHTTEERPLLVGIISGDPARDKFIDLPSTLKTSSLSFAYQTKEKGKSFAKQPLFPNSFGWLLEPGIYTGRIEPSFDVSDNATVDCQLLQFPDLNGELTGAERIPKDFLMTEFHAVMIYENCVRGICLLNEQVVFSCGDFEDAGKIKGMARDPMTGNFFVFADYAIYKFKVDREERNVWRIYLENGDFDLAQRYCLGDEEKLNEVLTRRANDLFAKGQFVESAMHFAKTNCSFEEIALKFMQIEEKTALLNYLKKKLELVRSGDKTQLTLVVVWLIENYLSRIRRLEDDEDTQAECEAVKKEFHNLLRTQKVSGCIDQSKNAIYDLLSSHGDQNTSIRFATFLGDYDRVIRCHLQNNDPLSIMDILREHRRPELYHQYGPKLMDVLPEMFIDAVIEQGRHLLPTKILPSLVVCSRRDQELHAIRYLEHCIYAMNRREPAVHNFLISLYVKHQPEKLEKYLKGQGYDAEDIPYDIEYTLRIFCERNLKRECLILYCLLGQLEEAVEIALDVDPELAQDCLGFAEDDDTKRKIWLRIAKYVVQQKDDIRQAMEYLKKSGDLIKIEDILPFFNDFTTIDQFKEAICDSLQEYSDHIEQLRNEMEESNKSADAIRADIQEYKNRYIFVRAVDCCSVCNTYLLAKAFHLFSCGHKFHTSCLTEQVTPYLSNARRRKLEDVLGDLVRLESGSESGSDGDRASLDSKSARVSRQEQLRSELDDIIAHECLFCGDMMIKMVDKPLIQEEEFEQCMSEWL